MTAIRPLSPETRHKIAQIKEALAKSDAPMHGYMTSLDQLDRSAKNDPTRDVSGPRVRVLDKIHDELMRALQRLGALDTGLRAQDDLRKALINSAAGYAAWSYALGSQNLREISAAQARVQTHFDKAADYGERGAANLERGI